MNLRYWRYFFLMTILLAAAAAAVDAQILPSRNMQASPLADTGGTYGLIARSHFFGELERGFNSAGDDRAWDATVGGFADLYRWESGTSLRVRFAQDMFANSLTTDIHFKPRAMEYEENISAVMPAQSYDWELGITYRCKHDIDNTDNPTSSITPPIDSIPRKRVLILGGLYGVMSPHDVELGPSLDLKSFVRADYYAIHEDNRFPANTENMLWSNVRGSAIFGGQLTLVCSPPFALYTLDWLNPVFAAGNGPNANANARAEAGAQFAGAFGALDVFFAYEHWFDDLSTPLPRVSNVVSVGLRLN
jgi:hypothetical protein